MSLSDICLSVAIGLSLIIAFSAIVVWSAVRNAQETEIDDGRSYGGEYE